VRSFEEYTVSTKSRRGHGWAWRVGLLPAVIVPLASLVIFWGETGFLMGDALGLARYTGSAGDSGTQAMGRGADTADGETSGVVASGEPIDVLVLGVDSKPWRIDKGRGIRTDTIMLARVFPGTGDVRIVSIPRDLFVEIEPGVEDKINAAFARDGVDGTIGAVENYTGMPIDHYAIVDFKGFEAVVDAMGGVEVDVEGDFPANWKMPEGVQTLNGHKALLYARYRKTAGGDLDRIRRQQQIMASVRSEALKLNTLVELPRILQAVDEHVRTDVGLREAVELGRVLIERGPGAKMTTTQFEGAPETLPDGRQVLVPDEGANERILEELHR
jgi:LCP family protein required for cell wall assembly